jgi:hypothetical protein
LVIVVFSSTVYLCSFLHFLFFHFVCFIVLGFELKVLCLPECTLLLETHLHPFSLWPFGDRVSIFTQASLESHLSHFMIPGVAGMTGMCHHAQHFPLRWDLGEFFDQAVLEL